MHANAYNRELIIVAAFVLFAWVGFPISISAEDSIDFHADVVPVLTKLGCNAGSCHGSAAGRGDFKLSLYGSRPQDDFVAIVLDGKGRRINRASASRSLFLRKPGGELDHGGDHRFDFDDPTGKILVKWIRDGAKIGSPRKVTELDVGKPTILLQPGKQTHQFRFTAKFSDETKKDVTRWTVLTSNDSQSVEIDAESNSATISRPGRHIVIARYMNMVRPIEILVPLQERAKGTQNSSGANFVDEFIYQKLNQLRVPVAGQIDDTAFLRRVSIDLTGRLPTAEQVDSFASDNSPKKRVQIIDDLTASENFTDYWTWRIAQQLRIRSQAKDSIGARKYHTWLRKQIANGQSWKDIAREMLLSAGDSHEKGQANFYRTTGDARLQAEFVTESLMGFKLRCANCHDHPLDHWTQDDYHGLAAIFATVRQAQVVSLNPNGENIHARTGKPALPRVPGQFFIDEDQRDARLPLADWVLDDSNPYFARAMVNRIWKSLMGRGLVEPVDDLRATNPATHPQLLIRLAADFVEHDFNIRHTVRRICNSEAYQREFGTRSVPENHRTFYANAAVDNLAPEILSDAICDVTGVPEVFPGERSGTRAIQLFDSKIPSKSLDILGRCSREESCESGSGNSAAGLSGQLHLLNGDLINNKISDKRGALHAMIQAKQATKTIVRAFYVSAFSRAPTHEESDYWIAQIDANEKANERIKRLEDFVWSILNSKEFTTNH